jgi:hypothetical protein
MAAAKRVKSIGAEPDEPSLEDERALNRLLALINGRGSEVDWEPLVGKEDRQQRG